MFWLWTVSLILDWYLSVFWPSCLPWYYALVSPLISLLPLLTTALKTVLTLIKAANGSPLCWLIITEYFDPAAVYRLSTEVSAQANVLVAHQQQLARLSSLTEEMVTTLQALRLSPSESAPPHPPVDPAPQAPPPSHSTASPRFAYLEKFDGAPAKCKGFLLQCSMFVSQQPVLYPTEESRIAFLCSVLTVKAIDWVTAVWNFNHPAFT